MPLLNAPGSLEVVFSSPQGLEVGEVEALALLLWIGEIKTDAWSNVIDFPPHKAIWPSVVLPCHPRLKSCFKVGPEFISTAAHQLPCRVVPLTEPLSLKS